MPTPEIQFRLVRLDEILDLRWVVLRAGLPREAAKFEGDDDPTAHHFAALENKDAIACATLLRREFEDKPAWQLRGVAVRADYQKRGLGTQLLDFAEQFVQPQNYSKRFWCNARVSASAFYERRGWRIVSEPFAVIHAGPHVKMLKDS